MAKQKAESSKIQNKLDEQIEAPVRGKKFHLNIISDWDVGESILKIFKHKFVKWGKTTYAAQLLAEIGKYSESRAKGEEAECPVCHAHHAKRS